MHSFMFAAYLVKEGGCILDGGESPNHFHRVDIPFTRTVRLPKRVKMVEYIYITVRS